MKPILAAAICVSSIVGLGAGTALGGEITGNGQRKQPISGNSICQFSG